MTTALRAVIKKEALLVLREGKRQIGAAAVMSSLVQLSIVFRYTHSGGLVTGSSAGPATLGMMDPTLSLAFVPPILVPWVLNTLSTTSLARERASGALMAAVATGAGTGLLWLGRTLVVLFFCYLTAMLVVQGDLVIMVYMLRSPVVFSFTNLFTVTVISPLAALAIATLGSFLCWVMRFGHFVASLLAGVVAVGLYVYALSRPGPSALLAAGGSLALGLGVTLLVCWLLVGRVATARILRLR